MAKLNHIRRYRFDSETNIALQKQWKEAEEKTFKNPLIFVKK